MSKINNNIENNQKQDLVPVLLKLSKQGGFNTNLEATFDLSILNSNKKCKIKSIELDALFKFSQLEIIFDYFNLKRFFLGEVMVSNKPDLELPIINNKVYKSNHNHTYNKVNLKLNLLNYLVENNFYTLVFPLTFRYRDPYQVTNKTSQSVEIKNPIQVKKLIVNCKEIRNYNEIIDLKKLIKIYTVDNLIFKVPLPKYQNRIFVQNATFIVVLLGWLFMFKTLIKKNFLIY